MRHVPVLAAATLAACTNIAPTNPYDASTPASQQAKAVLSGTVVPEATIDLTAAKLVSEAQGELASPDASGRFSVEVAAGTYALSVEAPSHETLPLGTLRVDVGEERDLGFLRLAAFRGAIAGTVTLAGAADHGGSLVSATPGEHVAVTDASGAFRFASLPVGTYALTVLHSGYATAVQAGVSVTRDATTTYTTQLASVDGDFSIDSGAAYTSTPGVTLDLLGFSHAKLEASESSTFSGAAWADFPATAEVPFALSAADGRKTVYVRFSDDGATAVEPVLSASIVLDATKPAIAGLTLGDGSGWTNDAAGQVTASFVAWDALAGVKDMRVSVADGAGAWVDGAWEALVPYRTVDLPNGSVDGTKHVKVVYRDAAGNLSDAVTRDVVLKRDPPAVVASAIVIDDGDSCTSSPIVDLGFGMSGATEMQVGDESSLAGRPWQPYPTTGSLTWALPLGDGTKTVYARFRDPAGNTTDVFHDDIVLDTTPPTVSVQLEGTVAGGAPSASLTRVVGITVRPTLADALSGVPAADGMQVSTSPDFSSAVWSAAADTAVQLAASEGAQRLWVRVRDRAGNTAVADASITYDATPPYFGSVVVDGGAAWVDAAANHTLTLASGDALSGVVDVCVSEAAPSCVGGTGACTLASTVTCTGTCTCAGTWEPFKATKTGFALGASAGVHTVYAQFRDAAGNPSAAAQASVALDLAAPTGVAFTAAGFSGDCSSTPHFVTTTKVALALSGSDDLGIADYQIAESGNFGSVPWIAWQATGTFDLSSVNGQKTLTLRVRDHVGRTADAANVCLTLDDEAPSFVGALSPAALDVATADVTVAYAAQDNVDSPADLSIALGSEPTTSTTAIGCALVGSYGPYGSGQQTYAIPGAVAGTSYVIFACVRDRAGNTSAPIVAPAPVRYDPVAPKALALNRPVPLASGVLLSWTADPQDTDLARVEISTSPTFCEPASQGCLRWDTDPGDCAGGAPPSFFTATGLANLEDYTLWVRARDCAGSPGPASSASTIVGVSDMVVAAALPGSVKLFSDGPDLWLHYPDSAATGQWISHCRAGDHDCRKADGWTTMLLPVTGGVDGVNTGAMLATDETLFYFDRWYDNVVTSTWQVVMASCDRTLDCTAASRWTAPVAVGTISLSDGDDPPGPAPAASDKVVAVAFDNFATDTLSISRCTRASLCRQKSDWTQKDFALPIERWGVTAASGEGYISVGFRAAGSPGAPCTALGSPVLRAKLPSIARCENFCEDVSACDGYRHGDLYFANSLVDVTTTDPVDAEPPALATSGGSVFAAWREDVSGTERVKVRVCTGADECLYAGDFGAATTLFTQATQPYARPSITLSVSGRGVDGGAGNAAVLRVSYADTAAHSLKVASCDVGAPGLCGQPSSWLVGTLATGVAADSQPSAAVVGQDVFVTGAADSGSLISGVLFAPIVTVPYAYFLAPKVGNFDVRWMPTSEPDQVNVYLAPGGRISSGDALAGLLNVAGTTYVSAGTSFSGSAGEGDRAQSWWVRPFSPVATPRTDVTRRLTTSIAAAENDASLYVMSLVGADPGKPVVGRFDTENQVFTQWNANVDIPGWSTIQLGLDYPRNWDTAVIDAGTQPRFFIAGLYSGNLWVQGCDPSVRGDCMTVNWPGFSLGSAIAAAPVSLSVVGDYAMVAGPTAASKVQVYYCDGAPTERNYCQPTQRIPPNDGTPVTPQPTDYCLHAENWKTVSAPLDAGVNASHYMAALAHPSFGWMVAQADNTGGVTIWTCARNGLSGFCAVAPVDCTNPGNWKKIRVKGIGSYASSFVDLTASTQHYFPVTNATDANEAVYASWLQDHVWQVASCRRAPPAGNVSGWLCNQADGSGIGKGWSATAVAPATYAGVGSGIRVVNGSVVLGMLETERLGIGICPRGIDCFRGDSWRTFTAYSGFTTTTQTWPRGLLVPDLDGGMDFALAVGSGLADTGELRVLTGAVSAGP